MKRMHAALAMGALLCAGSLPACGGGGYGGSSSGPGYTPPMTTGGQTLVTYSALLNGSNETPPNASMATGTGTVSIDPNSYAMTANISTTGIVGIAAHIHQGAPGVAGPVVFPLTETSPGSGMWQATTTITAAQYATFNAGGFYFNVHSAAFPNGEIRGQIQPR